jgi:hypothetical protein
MEKKNTEDTGAVATKRPTSPPPKLRGVTIL